MLAVMLAELARRTDWSWDDAIEVQRRVLGYRSSVHDLSPDLEADGFDLLARIGEHGLSALHGSSSTAHVSAVDSDGNACAITMSSGYSAGLCIPGTGILLNNTLGEVELNRLGLHALRPGHPAGVQHGAHHRRTHHGTRREPAAGHRLSRRRPDHHGADARPRSGLPPRPRPPARDPAPRLHVRVRDDGFVVEHERDEAIAAAVARSGLPGHEYAEPHMYFGGVGAALGTLDGELMAAGDARREAATGVTADGGA